jgi:ABC-type lipoprotein release transport system permease subunit
MAFKRHAHSDEPDCGSRRGADVACSAPRNQKEDALGTVRRGTRNVLCNPIRLVIVTILLGISLMFAAATVASNAGTQQRLEDTRTSIGPTINIWPTRSGSEGSGAAKADGLHATLSEETLRTVAQIPGVENVYGRIETQHTGPELKRSVKQTESSARPSEEGANINTVSPIVVGVDPDDPQASRVALMTAKVVTGRELTENDTEANIAIMGKALAEANGLDVGSRIDIEGKTVTIVGLYETGERLADNSLMLPLKTMQSLYGIDGVSWATVYVARGTQASAVADKIGKTLGDSVELRSQEELCAPAGSPGRSPANSMLSELCSAIR